VKRHHANTQDVTHSLPQLVVSKGGFNADRGAVVTDSGASGVSASDKKPWHRSVAGFTLLELMVVIVIIAILAGFVSVNLNIRNTPKTIREEAQRLGLLMQLASEQSVYSRAQLGIRFHPEDYEFYFLATDESGAQTWQVLEDERLRFRESIEELEFQVDISGVPVVLEPLDEELAGLPENSELRPHVMFLSNGEIIPDFSIELADSDARFRHQIFAGEELPVVVEQLE